MIGAFVAGVLISLAGCGPGNPAPYSAAPYSAPQAAGCPQGTYNLNGTGCVNAINNDFVATCAWAGGILVQLNGAQVCKTVSTPYTAEWAPLPGGPVHRLGPSNPADPSSYTGTFQQIRLARGDLLTVSAATGGWSAGDYTCSGPLDVLVSGQIVNPSVAVPGYGNEGLGASDGIGYYFIGSAATAQIQNNGLLHFGFNVPPAIQATCDSANIQFTITSCRDASGNSYLCP